MRPFPRFATEPPSESRKTQTPPAAESGIQLSSESKLPRLWEEDTESTTRIIPASCREKGRPRLLVMTGLFAGKMITLDSKREITIGRSRSADIQLDDPGVSRIHCRLSRREGHYHVEDLSSANGTLLNGYRVTGMPLAMGDRLQVGPVVMQLTVVDDTEASLAQDLYEASTRDSLTRTFNRRYFLQRLDAEIAHAVRHEKALSLLFVDLDHFKTINDRYGHAAGDVLLRAVAAEIQQRVRADDLLARYGGEEFGILVRETSRELATLFAERIRISIASLRVAIGETIMQATVSVGIAELTECGSTKTGAELLRVADKRLYAAKETGRNRVNSGM